MFGSRNNFFTQEPAILIEAKANLITILKIRGRSNTDINKYLKAYDFFTMYPSKYDGATIVKDLVDVRTENGYLDCDAMLHDYEYIKGANRNFKKKWKADIDYIKGMEKNGKGVRIFRLMLLTITGIVFVPYVLLKK